MIRSTIVERSINPSKFYGLNQTKPLEAGAAGQVNQWKAIRGPFSQKRIASNS